jgi:hypothetical protein
VRSDFSWPKPNRHARRRGPAEPARRLSPGQDCGVPENRSTTSKRRRVQQRKSHRSCANVTLADLFLACFAAPAALVRHGTARRRLDVHDSFEALCPVIIPWGPRGDGRRRQLAACTLRQWLLADNDLHCTCIHRSSWFAGNANLQCSEGNEPVPVVQHMWRDSGERCICSLQLSKDLPTLQQSSLKTNARWEP